MEMQRPAIAYERGGRHTNWDESAAETSFLNGKCEKVVPTDHVNRETMRLGCDAVVSVQNPACAVSSRGARR